MQNTEKDQCGEKKPKILEINVFEFSMIDKDDTEVGEVQGRLQKGFLVSSNEFYKLLRSLYGQHYT
jgi:hypothetical protein